MANTNYPETKTREGGAPPAGDEDYFSIPGPGVRLYFYGGSLDNTSLAIDRCGDFLFGRAENSDFKFSDTNRIDAKVSRKHAVLRIDRDAVVLANQEPRNGLMLNGVSLAEHQEEPLNDTDIITLGVNGPNVRVRIGDLRSLRSAAATHGAQYVE